jgi:uncharacterized protein YbjT (DUF2867 family)
VCAVKVILFGASGMVGQGVLRECLLDDDVTAVVSILRKPTGRTDPKLVEVEHRDFTDFSTLDVDGFDACFFCLGISVAGLSEEAYRAVTYDITLAAATRLLAVNPDLTFVYVSGQGTDAHGRTMWARVKGETEDAVIALSPNAYALRPGFIRPLHGERSGTRLYRLVYAAAKPFGPLIARADGSVTSTVAIGRAMLSLARAGGDPEATPTKRVLENRDINAAS